MFLKFLGMFGKSKAEDALVGSILGGLGSGALAVALISILWLLFLFVVAVYVYTSFVYMAIAKKAKFKPEGIAWIPYIGPLIITSQTAKMPWWPILFVLGFGIPFVGWYFEIALMVFSTIWLWKTFEKIKITNWFALLCLIPVVNLVILGIAAWSKKK